MEKSTFTIVFLQGREKQVQRIRNLFHRQLSVPLANLRSLLLGYKAWEVEQGSKLDSESSNVDGIPSHIASAYQKALDMFHARIHLEEQISKKDISDTEKFQQFMVLVFLVILSKGFCFPLLIWILRGLFVDLNL